MGGMGDCETDRLLGIMLIPVPFFSTFENGIEREFISITPSLIRSKIPSQNKSRK